MQLLSLPVATRSILGLAVATPTLTQTVLPTLLAKVLFPPAQYHDQLTDQLGAHAR